MNTILAAASITKQIISPFKYAKSFLFYNTSNSKNILKSLPTTVSFSSQATKQLRRQQTNPNNSTNTKNTTITRRSERKSNLLQRFQPHHFSKYKLLPFYVAKRQSRLKTYIGNERAVKHSPQKMNLICQLAARAKTVPESLIQLEFLQKRFAPYVHKVIKRTCNLADINDGLQPSQLEVEQCFATPGHRRKGITYHARGRSGKRIKRYSHVRLVLREIDFDLKILQAKTLNEKAVWLDLKDVAERDAKNMEEENKLLRKYEERLKAKREKEKEQKKGNKSVSE